MKKASLFLAVFLAILFCLQTSVEKQYAQSNASQVPAIAPSQSSWIDADYGKMPLQFIPNKGQMDERVAFYVQGGDKSIYFTREGLTFALAEQNRKEGNERTNPMERNKRFPILRSVVKLDFLGSANAIEPVGLEKSGTVVSYFRGKPEDWKTGLSSYTKIVYRNLWPGIDLLYYGARDKLKYEFIVYPNADPTQIRLAYRGAETVRLTPHGRLEVKTLAGNFEDDNPVAYQEIDGRQKSVPIAYALTHEAGAESLLHVFGFEVGTYDRSRPLILDPGLLVYCGYIGGSSREFATGIAVDELGNAYITGRVWSDESTFPVAVGPDLTLNGGTGGDAFVCKISASGKSIDYCGFIGGSGNDEGDAIAVDASGNAYICGWTDSSASTFPVLGGPDLSFNGGATDAFVAKINASGTSLDYCGYIGGSGNDFAWGLAVDGSGAAYVTGRTSSNETSFPVKLGPDLIYNGIDDAYVAKINVSGTSLDYCGYIGGSRPDYGIGIAVDSSGFAYVVGGTNSDESTFPVTGALDPTYNGGTSDTDGFVAKVDFSGSSLIYCGYIVATCDGIAVDNEGNAYVVGTIGSHEYSALPVAGGPDLTFNGGGYDVFVAKIYASGASFVYCGFIGGTGFDAAMGIDIDNLGNAYVVGWTDSTESTFPVTKGIDRRHNGGTDGFVARINAFGSALDYCGYIGGSDYDRCEGIAVDASGNAYVAGMTYSTQVTFPVNRRGPDWTYNGGQYDAFVAKIRSFRK